MGDQYLSEEFWDNLHNLPPELRQKIYDEERDMLMKEYHEFKVPILGVTDLDKETEDDIYKFLYGCHNTKIRSKNTEHWGLYEDFIYGKLHYLRSSSISGPDLIFSVVQEEYDPYYHEKYIVSSQNFQIQVISVIDNSINSGIEGDYAIIINVFVKIEWDEDLQNYILEPTFYPSPEDIEKGEVFDPFVHISRFRVYKRDVEECLYG